MKQKRKLSPRFLIALTVFSLMGQIAWVVENMYFNVFIYEMFHATPSDISAMVMASAVAATLTTVFMGALSDRVGIMRDGRLLLCDTPQGIRERAGTERFEEAFVRIVKGEIQ